MTALAACCVSCDAFVPDPVPPGPAPKIVRTDVDPDAGGVPQFPRERPISFDTDRLLAPRSVSRATVQVVSGGVRLSGRVHYDPARRRVWFVPDLGQMRPGLEYSLVIRPGLLSWDGVSISNIEVRSFIAADVVEPPPLRPSEPTLRRDVAPLLIRRCASSGCHRPPRPVMGLDLSSPEAIRDTTVAVMARQRPGTGGRRTDLTDPHWAGMYRVDPGRTSGHGEPAYSYLVYKLLGDGPILGERMPPPPDPPLSDEEIATVADWIARGAPDD